ncbi:MAG TPA: glycosyltransferase family 4 protein [Phycisphaerae bacterium]|nr:glycosyltransferase family 4 protein [Phycisphaerae bacterium]
MRIVHVITRLIVGGAQENTLLTCEGLHRRGHKVTLITGPSLGPEGSLMDRANAGGYKVIVLNSLVRNPHPVKDAIAYHALRRLCREIEPGIFHTHSSKAGILGRAAAYKETIPAIVHTIHGLPFHPYQSKVVNAAWIYLERWAAHRCQGIVCVADAMIRQALAAGVGRPEQFTTIYSGMDIEPFVLPPADKHAVRRRLNIHDDRIVAGTIARLQPLKGHDDILNVAGKLLEQFPQLHFLWIGDGVFRERFTQLIKKRGWQDHFTLTGLVQPGVVAELLPAMDLLVHPSYREGLPRAVVQAALAGIPSVTYNCDGADEICIDRQTGRLVPPGDVEAMHQAIAEIISSEPLRSQMGTAGQKMAISRFDSNVMVDKLEALYMRLKRTPGESLI